MEITGSGVRSEKDVKIEFLYTFPFIMKESIVLIILCVLYLFFLSIFYIVITKGGYPLQWPILASFIPLIVLVRWISYSNLYRKRKPLVKGSSSKVTINSSGIVIMKEGPQMMQRQELAWTSVKAIKIKGHYLHIYTKPRTKMRIIVPTRYFDVPNLLETVETIKGQGEG